MKEKSKILLILLLISIALNIILGINLSDKSSNFKYLNKQLEDILLVNNMEFLDYKTVGKNTKSTIEAVLMYQDKEDAYNHGVFVIINNNYYNIGIATDQSYLFEENSYIESIENNDIKIRVYINKKEYNLKLTITQNNNDIHFKLSDL